MLNPHATMIRIDAEPASNPPCELFDFNDCVSCICVLMAAMLDFHGTITKSLDVANAGSVQNACLRLCYIISVLRFGICGTIDTR